jgi:hypothetical protein
MPNPHAAPIPATGSKGEDLKNRKAFMRPLGGPDREVDSDSLQMENGNKKFILGIRAWIQGGSDYAQKEIFSFCDFLISPDSPLDPIPFC